MTQEDAKNPLYYIVGSQYVKLVFIMVAPRGVEPLSPP